MKHKVCFLFLALVLCATVTAQDLGFVRSKKAHIRALASETSKIQATAVEGTKIEILSALPHGSWYPAAYGKVLGWIHTNDFDFLDFELDMDKLLLRANAITGSKPDPDSPKPDLSKTVQYYFEFRKQPSEWPVFNIAKGHDGSISRYAYQRSSLARTNTDAYRAWVKITTRDSHSLELLEVRCKLKQFRTIDAVKYSKQGDILSSVHETSTRFQNAVPDSQGDLLVEGVCSASRAL